MLMPAGTVDYARWLAKYKRGNAAGLCLYSLGMLAAVLVAQTRLTPPSPEFPSGSEQGLLGQGMRTAGTLLLAALMIYGSVIEPTAGF